MKSNEGRLRRVLVAALIGVLSGNAAAQDCGNLEEVGDTLTFGIPLAALALTTLKRDGEGALQWTKTGAMAGAATGIFKAIGDKTRPNAGTGRQSFVSGHSTGAFIGAAYTYTRYGKGWGIPAYGLAILTAYSRVCAQKHFADDVLGGAMVAMFANWYATSPHPDLMRVYPSFTSNGLALSWAGVFGGNREARDPENFEPRYRMVFEFGPTTQDKNIVRTPNQGGTTVDLGALEAEFHMTARFIYERYLSKKHEITVWYGPLGMTDFDEPTQPFTVGGTSFDPNDPDAAIFDSNYRWVDVRAGYRYNLIDNAQWSARAGISLQYNLTEFEVEQRNAQGVIVKNGSGRAEDLLPLLHASAAYRFNERWSIEADFDGISTGSEKYVNAALWVSWRPSRIWDLGIGGRYIDGRLDSAKMFNEVRLTDLVFRIGRSF